MIEQPPSGDSCQPRVSTRGLGRHPLPRRAAERRQVASNATGDRWKE
ncbi:hypothetical protein RISK_002696 [Rhodopirellula islandica]|uniref:Uncharacterized protein n=1 Tax=Rhodopirellula islandica TaxID=595434 RepID=A0A0J1BF88_RHOIS|nr:hypothetical protein RISK_002696 [Rhodopirellula islandica]